VRGAVTSERQIHSVMDDARCRRNTGWLSRSAWSGRHVSEATALCGQENASTRASCHWLPTGHLVAPNLAGWRLIISFYL
jgi:hypothetical protein